MVGSEPIGEQGQVQATPAGVRCQNAVEAEKMSRIADLLGASVEDLRIASLLNAKVSEGAHVREPQSLPSPDRDLVKAPTNRRGEDRLPGQMKMDLRPRPVGLQRCVEDGKYAGIPPARGRVTLDRIASFTNRSPDGSFERDSFQRVKGVEQLEVARLPPARHLLEVGAGVEALDHGENLLRPLVVDQVDCPLMVKERVLCV
jgi:hypothetical protein